MTRRKTARARHPHIQPQVRMPRLSDDCVVQVHDFIHRLLDCFEARYGHQIDRFYRGLCRDCTTDSRGEPWRSSNEPF
jgi:hypothetical protein